MFGAALAIDNNTLAIGAPLEDSSGSDATNNGVENAGAAYVYERTNNAWTFEQYVKASNADADNRFGSALALATDTLAVRHAGRRLPACTRDRNRHLYRYIWPEQRCQQRRRCLRLCPRHLNLD